MRVALVAGHVGSSGVNPPGDHGGGEAATFGILRQLMDKYDTTLVVENGIYPSLDTAKDYGHEVSGTRWKNYGPSLDWLQAYDAMIVINHHRIFAPVCGINILYTFFPQNPKWDTTGYQYILADSHFAARWVKGYWGKEAEVVYPPIDLLGLNPQILSTTKGQPLKAMASQKKKQIVCIGRFFDVPGGNNKRHDIIINAFKQLFLPDWELILCGAVLDKKYYAKMRALAGDDKRIKFVHDLSRRSYVKLIRESSFVWSATGYGADKPSGQEHFGIFVHEGHATGAIVIAHASGGPAEMGALEWQEPSDLSEMTLNLIENKTEFKKTQRRSIALAGGYITSASENTIVDYLERPDIFPPAQQRRKIYMPDVKSSGIKIGIISDSIRRTYGFSVPAKQIALGLKEKGYKIATFGLQDPWTGQPDEIDYGVIFDHMPKGAVDEEMQLVNLSGLKKAIEAANDARIPVWRGWDTDPNGWGALARFMAVEKPDILYIQYDLGNARMILDLLRTNNVNIPLVVHVPVEGAPIVDNFVETLRLIKVMNGTPLLYTEWAATAVEEAGGPLCPWVHLGGDHASFARLKHSKRQKLRKAIGWDKRFVIMFGGRNKGTKNFTALFDTMKIVIQQHPKALMYLHTNPNDHIPNSSLPLGQLRSLHGLDDYVIFPPDLDDQGAGVDYEKAPEITAKDTDDINQVHAANLASMSLIERMGCADLYLNLSKVEGFNLWLVEAMGMGLPIVSVNDLSVQAEVLGDAASYVPARFWTTWHTGSRLAEIFPEEVAGAVGELIEDESYRESLAQRSLKRYQAFRWCDTVESIDEIIKDRMGV